MAKIDLKDLIREIRGERSMAEFAELIGVSVASVSRYESGQRMPKGVVLSALLRVAEPEQKVALLNTLGIDDLAGLAAGMLASLEVP